MIGIVIIVLLLVVAAFAALGFGKPTDLGVRSTSQDLAHAEQKISIALQTLPGSGDPQGSLEIKGTKKLNTTLSDAELTAYINNFAGKWKYHPVKDVQIKIDANGFKSSGIVKRETLAGYAAALGFGEDLAAGVQEKLAYLPLDPPFYIEGNFNAAGGITTMTITHVKVGQIEVPEEAIKKNQQEIKSMIGAFISAWGIDPQEVTLKNGEFDFSGTVPETVGAEP